MSFEYEGKEAECNIAGMDGFTYLKKYRVLDSSGSGIKVINDRSQEIWVDRYDFILKDIYFPGFTKIKDTESDTLYYRRIRPNTVAEVYGYKTSSISTYTVLFINIMNWETLSMSFNLRDYRDEDEFRKAVTDYITIFSD